MLDNAGLLSLGYRYPNQFVTEAYNSPSSPYWALKAFLPLALPSSHALWVAEEKPLPELDRTRPLPHAGMVISRDAGQEHAVAFTNAGNGRPAYGFRGAWEKYVKFAYSTRFAFSVGTSSRSLAAQAPDSMLAVSVDGSTFHVRKESAEVSFDGDVLYSRWHPAPALEGVEIETWLVPGLPWHVRVHRLRTGRRLIAVDAGFAIDGEWDDGPRVGGRREEGPRLALACAPNGSCGVRDLLGSRDGEIIAADPNTNLYFPHSRIPALRGQYDGGEHWLATAVFAAMSDEEVDLEWHPPSIDRAGDSVNVTVSGTPRSWRPSGAG